MRVTRLYGKLDLRLEEDSVPKPGAGEALIEVKAAGICGSDVHYFVDGRIGDVVVRDPVVLGHEFSGIVKGFGPGVEGLEIGTRVAIEPGIPCWKCEFCKRGNYNLCLDMKFCGTFPTDGCYKEYFTHPVELLFPIPDNVSYGEGAMIEPLSISVHSVDLARIKAGARVAVLGAGSMGLTVLQMARVAGAGEIYVTDKLDPRLRMASKFGATEVINVSHGGAVEPIKDLTGGQGVDVVFEAAGAPETPWEAVEIAKPGGAVILIGIPEEDKISFAASPARRKGLTIRMIRRMKGTYPRSIDLVSKGMVDVSSLITHRFKLDQIEEAFDLVRNYRDGVVKAVIEL